MIEGSKCSQRGNILEYLLYYFSNILEMSWKGNTNKISLSLCEFLAATSSSRNTP